MIISNKIILNTTKEERLANTAMFFDEIQRIFLETDLENELEFATWIKEERELYCLFYGDNEETYITHIKIKDSPAESIDIVTTTRITCKRTNYFLISALINRLNKSNRFGALILDEKDGSISFRYSYCLLGRKFNHEEFILYFLASKKAFINNFREIKRIAVGKLSDEEKVGIFSEIEGLVKSLVD
jgi:hypothetical protein